MESVKKILFDTSNWPFWLIIIIIGTVLIWLFFGGGNYEYIGLKPLQPGVDSTKYVDPKLYKNGNDSKTYSKESYSDESYISESDNERNIVGIDKTPALPNNFDSSESESKMIESYDNNSEYICQPSNINNQLKNKSLLTNIENISQLGVKNFSKIGTISESSEIIIETPCPKEYKNARVSKGEKICKQVLEEIYGKKFITVRPNFLKNPETNRNLELDCYNHELKIAVEYNGVQHYVWPNFTGQTKEEFTKQLRRDKFKVEQCDKNGVYLITVPYNVPHNMIKDYIIYYLPENVEKRLHNK